MANLWNPDTYNARPMPLVPDEAASGGRAFTAVLASAQLEAQCGLLREEGDSSWGRVCH